MTFFLGFVAGVLAACLASLAAFVYLAFKAANLMDGGLG